MAKTITTSEVERYFSQELKDPPEKKKQEEEPSLALYNLSTLTFLRSSRAHLLAFFLHLLELGGLRSEKPAGFLLGNTAVELAVFKMGIGFGFTTVQPDL